MCRARQRENHSHQIQNDTVTHDENTSKDDYTIRLDKVHEIHATKLVDEKMISVTIDGVKHEMELDTGAPCGIISSNTLRKIKANFH